jgi:FAD/FMN-containing dehydrogenase
MAGRIVLPDAADYDDLRRPAIARFDDIRPAAIARCATPDDVADAVAYARETRLRIAVRAGGHSFAGWSSTDGVVIDVRPTSGVTVSGGRAVIGAGTCLGDVYDALSAHRVTIPAGCGPTVGIAGLTLGGGLGILGRTYGLTCDSLRAATVVLADGRRVDCDEGQEADLFWALRGGGAPGVVTQLVFATVPAPDSTAFRLAFPAGSAAEVLEAWQRSAPPAEDAVAASLVLSTSSEPHRAPAVTVFGAILGSEADGSAALEELTGSLGVTPTSDIRRLGTHRETKRWLATADPHDGPEPANGFTYLRSEYFRGTVPAAALVDRLTEDRRPGESRELDFSPWAGAYNRTAADATAFPHRDARFLLKHSVTVGGHTDPAAATAWLESSYAVTHPYGTGGVYPNFPEPGLSDTAYYGANTDRLHRVRAAYDPEGVFAPWAAAVRR